MMGPPPVFECLSNAVYSIGRRASRWGLGLAVPVLAVIAIAATSDTAEAKYAAFVIDANTGQVFYARNADRKSVV